MVCQRSRPEGNPWAPDAVIARGVAAAAGRAGLRGLVTTPQSLGLSRMTDRVTA